MAGPALVGFPFFCFLPWLSSAYQICLPASWLAEASLPGMVSVWLMYHSLKFMQAQLQAPL